MTIPGTNEPTAATEFYPHVGLAGTTVIGPECFGDPGRGVICWQGENYYRAPSGFRFRLARLLGVGR